MPTPRNISLSKPWTSPAHVGQTYFSDVQQGFKTNPGESRNQVLPYFREKVLGRVIKTTFFGNVGSYTSGPHDNLWKPFRDALGAPSGPGYTMCRNRAYAKFRDKAVGKNSAVGVFAAERREGYNMVANRVKGLYDAYRELRRGDLRRFCDRLRVRPKRKHKRLLLNGRKRDRNRIREVAHQASGLWLEYWFGWSPMVNDIYNAVDVFQQELPSTRYSGGARYPVSVVDKLIFQGNQQNYELETETGFYICHTGATVLLVNPDLFLANQLGLTNPVAILWEVVPFSFVVDWFTKVGDVIQSTSDWVGLDLLNPYQSMVLKGTKHTFVKNVPNAWNFEVDYYRHFAMYRKVGLLKPTIVRPVIGNFGHSKTRAATAVSLLIALFIKK